AGEGEEKLRCLTTESERVGALRIRHRAEIIQLAELHTAVAQDVVGGGDVEEEVGDDESVQVAFAGEVQRQRPGLHLDRLVFAAVDVLWLYWAHAHRGPLE